MNTEDMLYQDVKKQFAITFNELLELNKIKTNVAAAKLLDVDEKTIRRWKKGISSPIGQTDTMQKIYERLNVKRYLKIKKLEDFDSKYDVKSLALEVAFIEKIEKDYNIKFSEDGFQLFLADLKELIDKNIGKYK
jgi:hypothetical protein